MTPATFSPRLGGAFATISKHFRGARGLRPAREQSVESFSTEGRRRRCLLWLPCCRLGSSHYVVRRGLSSLAFSYLLRHNRRHWMFTSKLALIRSVITVTGDGSRCWCRFAFCLCTSGRPPHRRQWRLAICPLRRFRRSFPCQSGAPVRFWHTWDDGGGQGKYEEVH
jgi:hypothetical protein